MKLHRGRVEVCHIEVGVVRNEKPRLIVILTLCVMRVDIQSSSSRALPVLLARSLAVETHVQLKLKESKG